MPFESSFNEKVRYHRLSALCSDNIHITVNGVKYHEVNQGTNLPPDWRDQNGNKLKENEFKFTNHYYRAKQLATDEYRATRREINISSIIPEDSDQIDDDAINVIANRDSPLGSAQLSQEDSEVFNSSLKIWFDHLPHHPALALAKAVRFLNLEFLLTKDVLDKISSLIGDPFTSSGHIVKPSKIFKKWDLAREMFQDGTLKPAPGDWKKSQSNVLNLLFKDIQRECLDTERKELGVTDEVAKVAGITTALMVALGNNDKVSLEDLADLSGDELMDVVTSNNQTTQSAAYKIRLSRSDANSIVMDARLRKRVKETKRLLKK